MNMAQAQAQSFDKPTEPAFGQNDGFGSSNFGDFGGFGQPSQQDSGFGQFKDESVGFGAPTVSQGAKKKKMGGKCRI